MKICAIYNTWLDGMDLIQKSIRNIHPVVDGIIVVHSELSNNFLQSDGHYINVLKEDLKDIKINYVQCEPYANTLHQNELNKRNTGLEAAKLDGYTHFIMMDNDEFYNQKEFLEAKKYIQGTDLLGLVGASKVYFKTPTLTIGLDRTLVPSIHVLQRGAAYTLNNKIYPFAYNSEGNAVIDPTRRLNYRSKIGWHGMICHHYSWVRNDYDLKIEYSSASGNIKKSTIREDLEKAKPGYYCQFYRKELQTCDNYFNI